MERPETIENRRRSRWVFWLLMVSIIVLNMLALTMVPDTVWAGEEASSDNARFIRLAGHHGSFGGGAMTWESEIVVDSATIPPGRQVRLAYELSPETELVRSVPEGAQAVRSANGALVAVEFPAGVHTGNSLQITLRQPLQSQPIQTPETLRPPLVAGRVIQRVSLDGVVYQPAETNAVPLHPGYRAQKGLSDDQIDWCEESLGELSYVTGVPIFVMPDAAFFAAGGLDGELVDAKTHRSGRLMTIAAGFGALLVALGAGYYLLTGRARHEEADAFLNNLS